MFKFTETKNKVTLEYDGQEIKIHKGNFMALSRAISAYAMHMALGGKVIDDRSDKNSGGDKDGAESLKDKA